MKIQLYLWIGLYFHIYILFIVIVTFALRYNNIFFCDRIDKPVFFINSSAPFSVRAAF